MTGAQLQSDVVIVNHSSTKCQLAGPPTLSLFASGGAEIGTNPGAAPTADTTPVLMAPSQQVPAPYTEIPGGEAAIGLIWSAQELDGTNCLGATPTVARMTFNFPDKTGNLVVTKISPTPPFAPCGAVEVVAFSAIGSPAPAPTFKVVAKLMDPSRLVPGHLLKYHLLLRNTSKKAINLRSFCPNYGEGLDGVHYKASTDHALNCSAAGEIGAGKERIFAMQYVVPRNAPRELLDLEWDPLRLPWQLSIAPPAALPLRAR
jgi:hypothetical protein